MVPSGLRVGTPALTSRGFIEEDFVQVAEYIERYVGFLAPAYISQLQWARAV